MVTVAKRIQFNTTLSSTSKSLELSVFLRKLKQISGLFYVPSIYPDNYILFHVIVLLKSVKNVVISSFLVSNIVLSQQIIPETALFIFRINFIVAGFSAY